MTDLAQPRRLGLALSGGGFRAVLYHLGVIRFLRDAGLLSEVTHITSVSGGSVIGAHLVLNWDRYCGTEQEFDAVADELLTFLQMDIRNRIVRRFPLASLANTGRRIVRLESQRQLTRAGLLEQHYEQFLYGDTPLFHLPNSPRLYILATNLSEGSLCAFHRDGLLLQRRAAGGPGYEIEEVDMGLATVPMAVAASSAFPGFFPPLELRGKEVGANEGEFTRHAFTDGGIYDNLGLRMFHHLQQPRQSPTANRDDARNAQIDLLDESTQTPSVESTGNQFDGILVSDAGAKFKVRSSGRAGGLLRTALRSTDILMDRVNQLELESFRDTPGALFFPINRLVRRDQDATALHPEIQRQAALIRTDMDRFSDLEASALIRHGYCIARQCCRERNLITEPNMPADPPWDPVSQGKTDHPSASLLTDSNRTLAAARILQRSAARRALSTLFSPRDWPTYFWVPLLAVLVLTIPTVLIQSRRTAIRQAHVLSAVAETSPLYADVLDLLENGPGTQIPALEFKSVDTVEPLDFTGYDVVSDDRIYDLRGWTRESRNRTPPLMHARFRMRRTEQAADKPTVRIQLPSSEDSMRAEYLPETLRPQHFRAQTGPGQYVFETLLDFSHVPIDSDATLVVRQLMPPNMAEQEFGTGHFKFTIAANTGLVRIWVLLPDGRPHDQFKLNRFPIENPGQIELVQATTTHELPIGSIATFELINPKNYYRYECRWRWLDVESNARLRL
ncbi:patatin-like phospholipase family protein [Roseiconus nitratireducens]|uniref:patatin-like phospholipase family protein n=1 Tax=Roseiconus nitratireducens TaxID=2605748 RepID=UPI0013755BE3|nr:patatin-like phospholipase family protein [Roseiconus nitratireducens]